MTEQEKFNAEMYKEFEQFCFDKGVSETPKRVEFWPCWKCAYKAGAQNMMLGRYTGESGI